MEVLFKILFVIVLTLIAAIFCMWVFMVALFDAFQKNELPDMEDVLIGVGEKPIIFMSSRAMKKFAKEPATAARAYTRHLI